MIKRTLALGLAMGLAVAAFTGCGSASKPISVLGSGTLFSFVGDAPLCDVLTFRVPITGLTLTRTEGGGATVLSNLSASIRVNFAALKEFSTVLSINNIAEGTYNQATISFNPGTMIVPSAMLLILRRSEEHTSELQSRQYLVCRLLLEKKKKHKKKK